MGIRDRTTSHRKKNMTSNPFLNLQYMFWTRKQRTQVRKGTGLKFTGALLLTNRPQSYFPPQNLHLRRMVLQQCEPAGGASHSDALSFRGSFMRKSGVQKLVNRENTLEDILKTFSIYIKYFEKRILT